MKNLLLCSIVLFVAAFVVTPIFTVAQQKKPAPAKPVQKKQVDEKSVAGNQNAAKPTVSKPVETHTSSVMEQSVLDEINAVRKDPQKFIAYLEDYKKLFKGKTVYLPNHLRIETFEGVTPIDEAIEFLKKAAPLEPYKFANGLNKAAVFQLKDLIADSSIGHTSRDGGNLPSRLKKFGSYGSVYAENIVYYAESARDVVLLMIVDDGVKSRSHRKNIFSPNFKVVGIAFGKGKSGEGLCIIDFADSFNEPNQRSVGREF